MAQAPIQITQVDTDELAAVASGKLGLVPGIDGKWYAVDSDGEATEIGATKTDEVAQVVDVKLENYYTSDQVDAIITALIGVLAVSSEYQSLPLYQRGASEIQIEGTVSGILSGSIEAAFNGGAWQTIATIVDGEFSGVFVPTIDDYGFGPIQIRSKSRPTVITQTDNVRIGDLYLVCGDSISEGRGTSAQSHGVSSGIVPVVYTQANEWKELNDPADTGTSSGSQWPLLAGLLSASGVPIGMVTTGTGSRDLAGATANQQYYAKPNTGYGIVTAQAGNSGDKFAAMLLHFGPNASADLELTREQYRDALVGFASDIRADIQSDLPVHIGVFGKCTTPVNGTNQQVRLGIADALSVLGAGPNLLGLNYADGVHPKTNTELAIVAGRWYAALTGHAPPTITSAVQVGNSVVLTVDRDLASTPTTYTATLFRLHQGASNSNPTSATRTGARQITLAFASITDDEPTIDFVFDESHATATLPTSAAIPLPMEINGVSSVVQPLVPVGGMSVTPQPRRVDFNGTDGYATSALTHTLSSNASFTVEVNIEGDYEASVFLLSKNQFLLSFQAGYLGFGSTNGWASYAYTPGVWRFVYDHTQTGESRFRAFLDGVEQSKAIAMAIPNASFTGTNSLYIGARANLVSTSFYDGLMSGIRIWNRICLPDDANETSGLTLHLETLSGTTWDDTSDSNADAQLHGGAVAVQ